MYFCRLIVIITKFYGRLLVAMCSIIINGPIIIIFGLVVALDLLILYCRYLALGIYACHRGRLNRIIIIIIIIIMSSVGFVFVFSVLCYHYNNNNNNIFIFYSSQTDSLNNNNIIDKHIYI